jgi:hypothetical protein
MTIRRLSLPLLLALALAGCANGASDSAGAPAAVPPSASAPAATAVPSPSEELGTTKPPPGASKTLTGTITAGVEPNCLLLDDHLLIFEDQALRSTAKEGATVTVTGRAEEGVMTTCQQGTPFIVTAIRAN